MSVRAGVKRRVVLRAMLLGALAAVFARGTAFASRDGAAASRGLAERAAECVPTDRLLAELGARYLADTGTEASVSSLLARIAERWPAGATDLAQLSPRSLRRALAIIVQRDLERADVVLVDGWVLARSEARLYAVAQLVRRS
jgi:hypothetical protein